MKKLTFIYLIIIISIVIISCDRDEIVISDMGIHDVQIHVSDIDKELTEIRMLGEVTDKHYAVTALVRSDLGGCRSYHQTKLFKNENENDYSTDFIFWNPGETIRIDIYMRANRKDTILTALMISIISIKLFLLVFAHMENILSS